MEEIFRYLQLRQTQKLSEEQKKLVGLPLYPDQSLSELAKNLIDTADKNEQYQAVISRFREKEKNKNIITDIEKINPVIRNIYDWLNYKAKPIKIDEFKKHIQSLPEVHDFDIHKEWTLYADNLVLAVHDKNISINYCIDYQLLIKICYLFKLYLHIKNGHLVLKDKLSNDHINAILDHPVLIPALLLRSRCSGSCSEKGKVLLPTHNQDKANEERTAKDPCECKCNDNCQKPSFHCICINTYISDLFIIKEELARYEEGDIASIENILAGEKKIRYHRNLFRTEDTTEKENETINSEERDHQVSEKFSLQAEVKNTIDSKIGVDAGVTATIKYGAVATITPHANFTYNYSKSQSQNIARSYAKDITDRSVTKIQEKVRKLQVSKIISELEEKNKHSIDNTQDGADHRAGIYYWVNKVTHAQVFNHGKHLMFDLILPEPAALFKKLYQDKISSDKTKNEPPKPLIKIAGSDKPLIPKLIERGNYGELLNRYAISVANDENFQPPNETCCVQLAFAKELSEGDSHKTMGFSSNDYKVEIPKGYQAQLMRFEVAASTADPKNTGGRDEVAVSVSVANRTIFKQSLNEQVVDHYIPAKNWWPGPMNLPMNGEEGTISVAVAGFSTMGFSISGSISFECKLKEETYENWKVKIYNLVMADYNRKLDAYNASNNKNDQLIQIKGRNPFLNREIERNELKRHIIALLICNYFNGIGSMMEKVMPCGNPEIDFAKLEKDAPIIQFFEQVFEWNYITYLFYHSMWARKCKWPELIDEDSGDALFDKFLMAGASRIQVPVRPGMEEFAIWFLKTGQIWGASGIPPVSGDDEYVSMIQELKESKQCDYTDRPGLIEVTNASNVLKLTGSTFYWDFLNNQPNSLILDNDKDRELLLNYNIYRIVKVEQANQADHTAWNITIERPYDEPSAQNLKHAVGALFVGAPWEIIIPTKLVYLRNIKDKLPTYPLT